MFFPGAAVYMEKIAVGPEGAGAIDLNRSPTENVQRGGCREGDAGERPHRRRARARPARRADRASCARRERGSTSSATATWRRRSPPASPGTGVDMLMGIGGTPEGVISAAAIKCMGGAIQGRLWPRNDDERQALLDSGFDLDRVLTADDLVSGGRRLRRRDRRHRRVAPARRSCRRPRGRDRVARDALPLGHGAPDLGLPPERQAGTTANGGVMSWDELYETARAIVADDKGDPGRRRVHGHDQEAVRLDRRRVDGGEPPRLPEPALHDPGHGGVHRRRHPLRRDDPAARRRRHARSRSCSPRRASSRGSRSTPARSRSRSDPARR